MTGRTELRELTHFELLPEHITLLRHAYVGWQDCETGAPEIDPKRPYGNSSVPEDVAEILGWTWTGEEMPDVLRERAKALHESTDLALQVILTTGEFRPGIYKRDDSAFDRSWRPE